MGIGLPAQVKTQTSSQPGQACWPLLRLLPCRQQPQEPGSLMLQSVREVCCIVLGGGCCNGPMLHFDPRAQVLGPSTSPQQHARPFFPTPGRHQLPGAAGTRPTSACC